MADGVAAPTILNENTTHLLRASVMNEEFISLLHQKRGSPSQARSCHFINFLLTPSSKYHALLLQRGYTGLCRA